jgi:hypothetical protein
MTTTTSSRNPLSKKVLIFGVIIVAAVTLLTAAISSGVLAQVNSSITGTNQANPSLNYLPNITGSIPLGSTINGAISSKVKTTLSDAVSTAQKAVGSNTFVTSAFIRPLNGYLVYDIHVRNNSNNAPSAVIIDPGNGKVLYTQALQSSFGKGYFGPIFRGYSRGGEYGSYGHHWFRSGFMKNCGGSNGGDTASNFAGIRV